jgi:hypothetical protein
VDELGAGNRGKAALIAAKLITVAISPPNADRARYCHRASCIAIRYVRPVILPLPALRHSLGPTGQPCSNVTIDVNQGR